MLPSFGSPTLFPSSRVQTRATREGGKRPCDSPAARFYDRSWDRRRGSTLTRVPASSIDRRAPRSMSSRCASSAFATMLTITSESRSCDRICTTLGPSTAPAARIAEKSRSFVMTTKWCSVAYVRISTSGAFAAPMVDQWTASNP